MATARGTRILLYGPGPRPLAGLSRLLSRRGDEVSLASGVEEAQRKVRSRSVETVFVDLSQDEAEGADLIRALQEVEDRPQTIAVVPPTALDRALWALRKGAADYLTLPVEEGELAYVLAKVLQRRRFERQVWAADRLVRREGFFPDLIGTSPATRAISSFVAEAAAGESPALLAGEPGTGKDLVARLIHMKSGRASFPFVQMDCGGVPSDLHTAQLMGTERHAFTRQAEQKSGLLEVADGGTLFLDQVELLAPAAQAGLLRAIEAGEIRRVGGASTLRVNVRVVATSISDLGKLCSEGRFRRDLQLALGSLVFRVPSLRERARDVPPLAEYFLERLRGSRREPQLAREALSVLKGHAWPGNVRELRNLVERLVLTARGKVITARDVRALLTAEGSGTAPAAVDETLEGLERRHIAAVLERYAWNKTQAARALGVSLRGLYNKIAGYGLRPPAESRRSR